MRVYGSIEVEIAHSRLLCPNADSAYRAISKNRSTTSRPVPPVEARPRRDHVFVVRHIVLYTYIAKTCDSSLLNEYRECAHREAVVLSRLAWADEMWTETSATSSSAQY